MTIRLFSGYSTDYLGAMTVSIAKGNGTTTYVNVGAPTGKFFTGFSGSVDFWNYNDFLVQLGNSLSNNYSGLCTFTFSYDWPSNRVRLLSRTGSNPVGMNFIWDINLQKILGFPAQHISQSAITGSTSPWYVWTPTNDRVTADSEIYENAPIYNENVADSGRTYSTGRTKTVQYQDWTWGMELRSNLFQNQALVTNSFTYDVFVKELRKGPYHFVKFDDIDQTIVTMSYGIRDGTYEIRETDFAFKPQKLYGDKDDYVFYWNVPIKTRMISRPNQNLSDQFGNLPVTSSVTPPTNGLSLWLKASAGGGYVSQSSGQGICYSQANDFSGMGNHTQTNTNSYLQLVTRSTLGGACYGVSSGSAIAMFLPSIGDTSASFYNSTASGITFAFPAYFTSYIPSIFDYNTIMSMSCINSTSSISLQELNSGYTNPDRVAISLGISNELNDGTTISFNITLGQDHFIIITYNNATYNGNAWCDGSTTFLDNSNVIQTSASVIHTLTYSNVSVTNNFSYKLIDAILARDLMHDFFIPEILVYNYAISASNEVNQINQYFSSKYPTVSFSVV